MESKDDTLRLVGGPGCTQGVLGCIHDVPKLYSRPRVCGGGSQDVLGVQWRPSGVDRRPDLGFLWYLCLQHHEGRT